MSLPRYPEYRDSGVEWLGEVPAHWEMVKAKHVLDRLGSGGTPNTDDASLWATEGDGIPWVAIADMSDRHEVNRTARYVTQAGVESKRLNVWPAGTLLFSMYASLGHTAELRISACTNQAILALRPTQALRQRFLRFWLEFLRPGLIAQASSNTQDNLNAEKVRNFIVLVPSLQEQRDIATFLDHETAKIDALIAEQEKLIALLAEKRQATISHAVTRGLNPDAPMKDSGVPWLGNVPAHWSICAVRRVLSKIEQGWSPECFSRAADDDEWGVLKAGCVNGGIFDQNQNKALPPTLTGDAKIEVREGDLVMSRASGSPRLLGSVAYLRNPRPKLMLSDKLFRLRVTNNVLPEFFAVALASDSLRRQIENSVSGAEGLANNLPQSALKGFLVALPPIDEQAKIVGFVERELSTLNALRTETDCALKLLKERRAALISAVVTGQVDVREMTSSTNTSTEALSV